MKHELCPTCGQKLPEQGKEKRKNLLLNARCLFDFWKMVMNKPRSNYSQIYLSKITARLKEGYTEEQIAHAILGLPVDEFHKAHKLTHIEFIVRNGPKIEGLIRSAEREGITEEFAASQYKNFKDSLGFIELQDLIKRYHENNHREDVNPATGAKLK